MKKIIFFITIIIVIFALVFVWQIYQTPKPAPIDNQITTKTVAQDDKPQIISTKPDPLNETIISATETVEITFNRPLENVGEFKVRIEPEIEIKTELSSDRKTAKIKPVKDFQLGTTYTLFIGPETKFDGVGRWGEEQVYHFKTIAYRGV